MDTSLLHRANLSAEVARRIRDRVISGELRPGARLQEIPLSKDLGVSRTPVREALATLVAEGFLVAEARRGVSVADLLPDEVAELYPLRSLLDPVALQLSVPLPEARIEELRALNRQMEALSRGSGDPAELVDLDDQWHRLLLEGCPNGILLGFIEQVIAKSRRYEFAYMSETGNVSIATDQHETILRALSAGDVGLACQTLAENMTSAREPLLAWLRSRGDEGNPDAHTKISELEEENRMAIAYRSALTRAASILASLSVAQAGVGKATDVPRIDGFEVSSVSYDQEILTQLDEKIEDETYQHIQSIVVLREGKILVERYYNGASRDQIHNPRSVGKTFAGSVLGVAIEEGYIDDLDQPLADFYDLTVLPNPSPKKSAVTLRQLLTMSSGFEGYDFDGDSIGNENFMYPEEDWVRWTLSLPMATDRSPGEQWRYFTAGIVVLGDILNRSVPGGLESYAHEKLFAPLGITNYSWQYTPQRVANTAGGLSLTPLGFAKFGQLYQNEGTWPTSEGKRQIVPREFARTSLAPLLETTSPDVAYGYLWWRQTFETKAGPLSAAYCSGNGGNKIFVFEEEPLVVVITASAYNQRYAHSQVDEMMAQFILPAITTR